MNVEPTDRPYRVTERTSLAATDNVPDKHFVFSFTNMYHVYLSIQHVFFSLLNNKKKLFLFSFLIDRDSSFYVYSVMLFTRNMLFGSISHDDWYICQSKARHDKSETEVIIDFYNGDEKVLVRCTFLLHPIPPTDNKYKNCKQVAGPVEQPFISGQPLPHPPHLVPHYTPPPPVLPACLPVCPVRPSEEIPGLPPTVGPQVPLIPAPAGAHVERPIPGKGR